AREIHVALGQKSFRLTRRTAKHLVKLTVGHRKAGTVVEIVDLQSKRSVFFQVDEIIIDRLDIFRLTVGSEAHDFIFARIDSEPGVISKCGIQQPEGMREMNLPKRREVVAISDPG